MDREEGDRVDPAAVGQERPGVGPCQGAAALEDRG